jgi:hypothetical protein
MPHAELTTAEIEARIEELLVRHRNTCGYTKRADIRRQIEYWQNQLANRKAE